MTNREMLAYMQTCGKEVGLIEYVANYKIETILNSEVSIKDYIDVVIDMGSDKYIMWNLLIHIFYDFEELDRKEVLDIVVSTIKSYKKYLNKLENKRILNKMYSFFSRGKGIDIEELKTLKKIYMCKELKIGNINYELVYYMDKVHFMLVNKNDINDKITDIGLILIKNGEFNIIQDIEMNEIKEIINEHDYDLCLHGLRSEEIKLNDK